VLKELDNAACDVLSHWVLRVAFSASEDTRRRFIDFERDLFDSRVAAMSADDLQAALVQEGYDYGKLEGEELRRLSDQLKQVRAGNNASILSGVEYYCVPFTDVVRLVKARRVLVRKGFAYVASDELIEAVTSRFVDALHLSMETAARALPFIMRDERVSGLLAKLQKAELAKAHAGSLAGSVTKEQIPALARRSFPMCARNLEGKLTKVHHLKHFSRLQFTLFLKGIGLAMDDCLAYLRGEFMKRPTTAEEFRKNYEYSVKHAYGQVGARKNYPAWSCATAINYPGQGANIEGTAHGCPFAHVRGTGELEKLLKAMGGVATDAQVSRIMDEVKQGKLQIACRVHWEALHPGGNSEGVGNHPNAWFDESVKYYKQKEGASDPAAVAAAGPASAAAGFVASSS